MVWSSIVYLNQCVLLELMSQGTCITEHLRRPSGNVKLHDRYDLLLDITAANTIAYERIINSMDASQRIYVWHQSATLRTLYGSSYEGNMLNI